MNKSSRNKELSERAHGKQSKNQKKKKEQTKQRPKRNRSEFDGIRGTNEKKSQQRQIQQAEKILFENKTQAQTI